MRSDHFPGMMEHYLGDECEPDGHVSENKGILVEPAAGAGTIPDPESPPEVIRTFATGANRNSDNGKYDYEGFISPFVLERYAEYMHKNRHLANGQFRDSDNWQKGIPSDVLWKSALRHMMDVWMIRRGADSPVRPEDGSIVHYEEALCGLLFNVMGLLYNSVEELG